MAGYRIREAGPADALALTEALVEAANWHPDRVRPRVSVLADPVRRGYIAGWQRPADAGFLAEDSAGEPIGAGWYRLFPADRPGLGFVGVGVPELILGVRPVWRAQGVGRGLLQRLIARAGADGHARIALSVERGNYAQRLYLSEGFVVLETRGAADVMVRTVG
jgi:GNAT superfamily N-acetyltransferase